MGDNNKPTEEEVDDVLWMIIEHKGDKGLDYAIDYAKHGVGLSGKELKIQCMYILNNIIHWRKNGHKEVRSVLKRFIK